MSWRAESTFVSEGKEVDKEFFKIARKLREIKKLEEQRFPLEPNQKEKVASKPDLVAELCALDLAKMTLELWEKNADVFEMLPEDMRDKVFKKKNAVAKEKEDIAAEKEQRKAVVAKQMAERLDNSSGPRTPTLESIPRHSRPITDLSWDENNQFLYSSCKDKFVIRWEISPDPINLVANATYCGHEGAVNTCDVDEEGLVSGGADGYLLFWPSTKVLKGKGRSFGKQQNQSVAVGFTDWVALKSGMIKSLRLHKAGICIHTDKLGPQEQPAIMYMSRNGRETYWKNNAFGAPCTQVIWGPAGNKPKIFSSHSDGTIKVWGTETGEDGNAKMLKEWQPHEKAIHSMNTHKNYLLTASEDCTVQAIDVSTPALKTMYKAKANRPLRCVAAFDWREEKCFGFIYGGGRDPRDVTTSTLLTDEFTPFLSYFGNYKHHTKAQMGHVGPIHKCIWVTDKGMMFTGAEEGDVKLWMESENGGLVNPRY